MPLSEKPEDGVGCAMAPQLRLQREVLEQMVREEPTTVIFDTVLAHLADFIGCDGAAICTVDQPRNSLRIAAQSGFPEALGETLITCSGKEGHELFKDFQARGNVLRMPDRAPEMPEGAASPLAVFHRTARSTQTRDCWVVRALGGEEALRAVLLICFAEEREVTAAEQEFLSLIGNLLSMAVERDRARRLRDSLDRKLRQSQKMEAIGTLAGGIAHDFNNILGGLFGFVHLAKEDVDDDHPAQEWLREIDAACKRARDLVQQVLVFSRSEDLTRVPLNLEAVLKDTAKLVRASLPSSVGIEVHRSSAALPDILGNHTQIQLAVLNLCTNAWQASGEGRGRIELSLDVVSSGDAATPLVQLSVRDDGPGIPPEAIERIFDPFYSTRPVGSGTGLGLSVVHGILSAHDGQVLVESHPGEGTTFHLQFPALRSEAVRSRPDARAIPGGQGERVLFIDDEVAIVTWSRLILERMGYLVESFTDPEIALGHLEERLDAFDVVVSDLTMPGLSGVDVLRRVREWQPNLPVVLTSGRGVSLTPEEKAELKPSVCLTKPISMEALCEGLHQALHPTPA